MVAGLAVAGVSLLLAVGPAGAQDDLPGTGAPPAPPTPEDPLGLGGLLGIGEGLFSGPAKQLPASAGGLPGVGERLVSSPTNPLGPGTLAEGGLPLDGLEAPAADVDGSGLLGELPAWSPPV